MQAHLWTTRRLGDCAVAISGSTPSKANPDYWGGDIPWVSCKDMKVPRLYDAEDHVTDAAVADGYRVVPAGTILIVVRGMILAQAFPVAEVMRPVMFNQDLKALIAKEGVEQRFLYYWLLAHSYEVKGIADEAAHGTKRLQSDRLFALPVRLPPPPVQRAIVSYLSAYDDLIENNARRIEILEEMARSLYREWFVNFRVPGHDGVLLTEADSIPDGWNKSKLGDVIELAYGKALKTEDRQAGSYPVFGSSGVVGSHSVALVQGPGIVVGRKGNVGSVHWADTAFYPIDTVFYVKTMLPLNYVFFNLEQQRFLNSDAAVPGLNRNQAYSLSLIVPPKPLLDEFEKHASTIRDAVRNLRAKNVNLRTTRDLLLPKLISGEIDVSRLAEEPAESAKALA